MRHDKTSRRRRTHGDAMARAAADPQKAVTASAAVARWPRLMVPALAATVTLVGVAYRVQDFGRYGFWTDEAWVALITRLTSPEQLWLALSTTPVLWAGSMRLLALLPGSPEVTLRLLPLAFGCLTLWVAYRAGASLAGRPLGGLIAVFVLAFEPTSVAFAKVLKQYTAESCLALLALWAATRFARTRAPRDLLHLCLLLTLGLFFANSQLFLGPPILAALLLDSALRRDGATARRVALAALGVGAWAAAYYRFLLAPYLVPAMVGYWEQAYVPADAGAALWFVTTNLGALLAPSWSPAAGVAALAGVLTRALIAPASSAILLALVLLVVELALVSAFRRLPFNQPRVLLFLITLLGVVGGAGIGFALALLWEHRSLRPLAIAAVAFLVVNLAVGRDWIHLGEVDQAEDLGPLVRFVEQQRAPGDAILLYHRSTYVWAYYQQPTPVIALSPTTVGWFPVLDDPRLTIVDGQSAAAAVEGALARSGKVWFLGSRFAAADEKAITTALRERGQVTSSVRRPNSLLLVLQRTGPR